MFQEEPKPEEQPTPTIDLSSTEATPAPPQAPVPGAPAAPATETPKKSFIAGNKGLIAALVIGVIVIIIAAFALTSFGNSSQYQGLIKQVEQQTAELEAK